MKRNKISAGIVTFNPEIKRLKENIDAVFPQISEGKVIVVDNGSDNIEDIKAVLASYPESRLITLKRNYGIARALNEIFREGRKFSDWILTLDQDSVVEKDIISTYLEYSEQYADIQYFTCLRNDRNIHRMIKTAGDAEFVEYCITSGSLVSVKAWEKVNGFTEKLFIDAVDVDFCFKLQNAGVKILRINRIELLHEIGKSTEKVLFGKKRIVLNHSAFRKYYIFRNYIYIARKFPDKTYVKNSWYPRAILKILFYEDDKRQKLKQAFRGIRDGLRMSIDD